MYDSTLSRCAAETSAPWSVASSSGSPIRSLPTAWLNAATNRSKSGASTNRREPHRQISPWFSKAERRIPGMTSSRSTSANTTVAFLPPSSSESFLKTGPALRAMVAPVAVPPVNEMAGTSG